MASSITETHLTQSEPHPGVPSTNPTVLAILFAISFSHLLNDTIQSLIPAIYPLLKTSFHLSFVQVGFITLAFQMTLRSCNPLSAGIPIGGQSPTRSPAEWG
jgi:FSR family fosmidomycin resistance protein-like MFS transporter